MRTARTKREKDAMIQKLESDYIMEHASEYAAKTGRNAAEVVLLADMPVPEFNVEIVGGGYDIFEVKISADRGEDQLSLNEIFEVGQQSITAKNNQGDPMIDFYYVGTVDASGEKDAVSKWAKAKHYQTVEEYDNLFEQNFSYFYITARKG